MTPLILASTSSARRMVLANAGVECDAMAPMVDEDAIKQSFLNQGFGALSLADALAEAKAVKLSSKNPLALVIGADQTLECADGTMLDKAETPEMAIQQLRLLSGKTHKLYSAAVVAERGEPVWRFIATSRMTMRPLSDDFITRYVDSAWDQIRHCVGCYQVESLGAQLFSQIQGGHFDIMGLPLLPLLNFLRERGILSQ